MQAFVVSALGRSLHRSTVSTIRNGAFPPMNRVRWSMPRSTGRVFMSSDTGGDTTVESVRKKLTEALKPLKLNIIPTYGDPNGSHISIEVVAESFEGESVIKRHQMVYKAIWEEMQGPIHAVDSMVTKTPSEAGFE